MRTQEMFIGIDVGSVSTNLALLDIEGKVRAAVYLRTGGRPIPTVQEGLVRLKNSILQTGSGKRGVLQSAGTRGAQVETAAGRDQEINIAGVATTGSARHLIGLMVGADLIKNEITTHAVAALAYRPDVQTIMEIG